MNDCLIYLISETLKTDEDGNHIADKTKRKVFSEIQSISQKEFSVAAQNGLKPEYKFVVWYDEYKGERLVEYKKEVYAVYRTYKTADKIELYVTKKGGI